MNKIAILLAMALVLVSVSMMPHAWSYLPNYNNAVNVTVSNWNYSASVGATTYNEPVGFALVTLANLSVRTANPANNLKIEGYTAAGQQRGIIPFYLVSQHGNETTLLIKNTTESGGTWSTATVYYNPLVAGLGAGLQNPVCYQQYYQGIANCKFTSYDGGTYIIPDTDIAYNYGFGVLPVSYLSGVLNINTTGIVILANRSLDNTLNNITFNPTGYRTLRIWNASGAYKVSSFLGITTSLGSYTQSIIYGASQSSSAANALFNGTYEYDGAGFEAYLSSSTSPTFISEGVIAQSSGIYNSLGCPFGCVGTEVNLFAVGGAGYFNITSNTLIFGDVIPNSIVYYILPAFTDQYTTSVIAPNNGIANAIILNCTDTAASTPCTFNYKTLVQNVNWTYSYSTNAIPGNAMNTITIGSGKLGYLVFTITHDVGKMGNFCNHVYFVNNDPEMSPITFHVLNCTPYSSVGTFLLKNISADGNPYTSFYMYSGSLSAMPQLDNLTLLKDWQISSGANVLLAGNVPFIVNLNYPLTPDSVLAFNSSASTSAYGGLSMYLRNGAYNLTGLIGYFGGSINSTLDTGASTFLVDDATNASYPYNYFTSGLQLYTPQLSAVYSPLGTACGSVAVSWIMSNGFAVKCTIVGYSQSNFYMTLQYPITATLRRPYASYNCTTIHLCNTSYTTQLNITNSSGTLTIQPCNGTSCGPKVLNYNITPIDFGGTSDNVALAPGVDMPVYALLAVAVVLMIIGCAMMSQHELGHFPLVLMLLAVWALGLWQVELLYIAVILTIAFIVVEFIIPRSEKHRSEHHG